MVTYTEIYGNNTGIKDISASRFFYLSECLQCKNNRIINRRKSNFMRKYKKQHYDYIVYNINNI